MIHPKEYSTIVVVYDPWNGEPIPDGSADEYVDKVKHAVELLPYFRVDVSNSLIVTLIRVAIAKGEISATNVQIKYRETVHGNLIDVPCDDYGRLLIERPKGFCDREQEATHILKYTAKQIINKRTDSDLI